MQYFIVKIMRMVLASGTIILASVTHAATWYVAISGTGQGTGGWADATNSLPGTISAAAAGDTVLVSNGTYQLTAQLVVSKAITVQSLNGRDVTEIRGDYPNTVFRCLVVAAAATIDGFTIANGWQNDATDGGAGVYMAAGTLRNCRVTGNYLQTPADNSRRGGAGVYMLAATVSNCLIDGNILTNMSTHSVSGGGGVYMNHAAALLIDSEIHNNLSTNPVTLARGSGGGIMLCNGRISGCLIVSNNASGHGGGFFMNGGAGQMLNCTNAYNHTESWGGAGNLGSFSVVVPYELTDNLIYSNSASYGGGIYASGICSFNRCRFECNQAETYGGAVVLRASGSVIDCTFRSNRLYRVGGDTLGGAMAIWSTGQTGLISRCLFEDNTAFSESNHAYGGAILTQSDVDGVWLIDSCIIRNNSVHSAGDRAIGGGVYLTGNRTTLRNCLIYNNRAEGVGAPLGGTGGGVGFSRIGSTNVVESCTIVSNYALYNGAGVSYYEYGSSGDKVRNSIVHGNTNQSGANNWHFGVNPDHKTNVTYTCTPDADGTWGAGNIAGVPQFADPTVGDYRLTSGSPGLNTGTNLDWMVGALDLDGRPRLDRWRQCVDMGCYEYIAPGTMYRVR